MTITPSIFSSIQNSLYDNSQQFQNAANQIVSSTLTDPTDPSTPPTDPTDPLLTGISNLTTSRDQLSLDFLLLHKAAHRLDILFSDPPVSEDGFSVYA